MKHGIRGKLFPLAMAALLGIMAFLPAAVAETAQTTATVSFIDGKLTLDNNITGSGLNFDFGEHTIPSVGVSYTAENTSGGMPVQHILQVEDARVKSGDWHVTVALTDFSPLAGDSFDAMISLKAPAIANANAAAGTGGLTVTQDLLVASGGGEKLVMEADDTLSRGIYSLTWQNDDVALNIGDGEVTKLDVNGYSATLSWVLNVGP